MFKSAEKLIAEIHHEFDSAQERLLEEANRIIISTNTSLPQIAERLKNVGFVNTPVAKKGEQVARQLVTSKEQAELIQYYRTAYPFLKFLTEDELNRICEKYNLIHAPVSAYIQDVPEKNLRDIETAQPLKDYDTHEPTYLFKLTYSWQRPVEKKFLAILGKTEPIFTRNELHALTTKYYSKYGADQWVPEDMINFSNTCFFVITEKMGIERSSLYDSFESTGRVGLFIAAPQSHFNLKGLDKKTKHGFFNVLKTEVKDPIVFRYVRGGVQVITKWGLEANDPSLVVPILN